MFTWMLVEDETEIQQVLLAIFEMWGVQGAAFVDAIEAIEWINEIDKGTIQTLPEFALLDIRLPALSGAAVSRRIRQSDLLGQIPIVLMTAYRLSPEEEHRIMVESGADKLLYKPLPPISELHRAIQTVIEKKVNS